MRKNSELQLEESDITAKFIYRTKRNTRNLVTEVNFHTRKKIMNTRMKIGWVICNVDASNVADTTTGWQTAEERRHVLSVQ
jgi:predicted fused transcriptional regulator/phosphomethylpyrimidine kinase